MSMTGDAVTVFDAARTAAIAVLADRLYDLRENLRRDRNYYETTATKLLESLLAARSSTTCETCGGKGKVPGRCLRHDRSVTEDECEWVEARGQLSASWFHKNCGDGVGMRCRSCDGSGTVPGGPLILLAPERLTDREVAGVCWDAILTDPTTPAIYVAREST